MGRKIVMEFAAEKALVELGERMQAARKRRLFPLKELAEIAGIAPSTLSLIEKGSSGVAMGAYVAVLFALGMHADVWQIAADDPFESGLKEMVRLMGVINNS